MLEVEDLSSEVLSALTILSQSSFAVLRSGGELVDDKNERHWLSPVEFQGVLDAGSVVHPVTQEMVHDALQKVFPVFVVTADLVAEKAL